MPTGRPRTIAVIPARLASTRLPRKPLLKETGKYLIQHVYEAVVRASGLDAAVVATDSPEIVEAAASFGARAEMTRADHASGTDRMAEVIARIPEAEVAVNVQGDEPEVRPSDVELLLSTLRDSGSDAATLAAPCPPDRLHDASTVKVVVDRRGRALYFSRSPIPYPRFPSPLAPVLQHVGMYAFRRRALEDFASLPPTPLERTEGLEQLRLLEHGRTIAVATMDRAPVGVDTQADYERFVAHTLRSS